MKEPYGEGVAIHTGPESCVVVREGGSEALTGVRAGRVSSRENQELRAADAFGSVGRQHRPRRDRETRTGPARSKTPSTHGNISHGSREIPRPAWGRGCRRPHREVRGRTPMMDGRGKSDRSVVPEKRPNKAGLRPAAEAVEGRGLAKGNSLGQNAFRTQRRADASSALERVREAARRDRRQRFTALLAVGLRFSRAGRRRSATTRRAPGRGRGSRRRRACDNRRCTARCARRCRSRRTRSGSWRR